MVYVFQKHVYVYCLFGTGWMRGRFFFNFSSKLKPGSNKKNESHNLHSPFKVLLKTTD